MWLSRQDGGRTESEADLLALLRELEYGTRGREDAAQAAAFGNGGVEVVQQMAADTCLLPAIEPVMPTGRCIAPAR
ncbi:hypothetical protein, partial [Streptomyces scopuliridis]|uniref:hypothetical protein n=1 Tax=Streptomyces scopuliridis TaxID=452529 RepID=UPI0019CFDF1D